MKMINIVIIPVKHQHVAIVTVNIPTLAFSSEHSCARVQLCRPTSMVVGA